MCEGGGNCLKYLKRGWYRKEGRGNKDFIKRRLEPPYQLYVWAGDPSCYLELLDKLKKLTCRAVSPSLATSLEPLPQCQNVASLSLFYRYYFGRCSSELAQLVPLSYSGGRSARYQNRLHDLLSPFLDVTRMSMATISFLAQLDSGILCHRALSYCS